MSSRSSRRRVSRLGAGLVSIGLALAAAGLVNADTGTSSALNVSVNGLSIQVSGTWTWPVNAANGQLHYSGFAIDWGDVTAGNQVGTFHIGDGTPATNVIMQPTTPDRGTSGSWGPVGHTYAKAGTYTACVIMYDIGTVKPFKTTGYHSLQATGPGHNIDNAVEHGNTAGAVCATFAVNGATPVPTPTPAQSVLEATAIADPTPTPFQSVQGATSVPVATAPPTATSSGSVPPGNGGPALPLVLLALSCLFGAIAFKPVRAARRR